MSWPTLRDTPRLFVERRWLAWSLLILSLLWGAYAFRELPRRKDPEFRVAVALVIAPWPGHGAHAVEQELTRPLEQRLAAERGVAVVSSVSRADLGLIEIEVDEAARRPGRVLGALRERLARAELPPGAGPLLVARDRGEIAALLLTLTAPEAEVGALERAARELERELTARPEVKGVLRVGRARDVVTLDFAADRWQGPPLAELRVPALLAERGLTGPDGVIDLPGPVRPFVPLRRFQSQAELEALVLGEGLLDEVRVRDLFDVRRGPEDPPTLLHFAQGLPAVTLAVERSPGVGIRTFGHAVDAVLARATPRLPAGVQLIRLTDEPREVEQNLALFEESLLEAIVLIVLVAWLGFQSWRSASVMALSIPLTLALTFGLMRLLEVDLQQVSVGALILALGLLIDDPVVAGDAIQRQLDAGAPRRVAAARGPIRLARAIFFATLTNVVAYLPLLVVRGHVGRFIASVPVVITCSLIASRLVSMTFVPLLGYHLLRPGRGHPAASERLSRALTWVLARRKRVLALSLLLLALGGVAVARLRLQFFPADPGTVSYVDLRLPGARSIDATAAVARRAEQTIERLAREEPGIQAVASFVGAGAPRFWFSVATARPDPAHAQLVIRFATRADTSRLQARLQRSLDAALPEALVDVRELEIGRPIAAPVQLRVLGPDLATLRRLAGVIAARLRADPRAARVRDDAAAASPPPAFPLAALDEAGHSLPVLLRWPTTAEPAVDAIPRRQGERAITVSAFAAADRFPSEVLAAIEPALRALRSELPPGYRLEIGGEHEEQVRGFRQLTRVLVLSVVLIYAALAVQFRSLIKPWLVLAAIPFGVAGALAALWVMHAPFGFMAFMGVASLIGVIVSHVIVLFDAVEESRAAGQPLREALVAAGVARLRPVLITVAATVIALVPLAQRGGPLWEPLCYAQIGGLTLATVVTLVLGPVLYAVCVMDLGIVRWPEPIPGPHPDP